MKVPLLDLKGQYRVIKDQSVLFEEELKLLICILSPCRAVDVRHITGF
jgi:hypothetical protein